MKINLIKVVLHILDNNHQEPIISTKELDIEKDVSDFLEKHISKLFNDGDLKKAYFDTDKNEVSDMLHQLIKDDTMFLNVSTGLARRLFSIMIQNPDIPSGDVVFCMFEMEGSRYFSLIKLNYRSSYIHFVLSSVEGNINRLIKQKTALPGETQKVDECMIINLNSLEMQIIEKQYEICGEKEFYLSKYFLKCKSDLSYIQKMKVLDKTVTKISKKYFDENFEKVARLRSCLAEGIEESNKIKVDQVAETVFSENKDIQNEYLQEVKKQGVIENTVTVPEAVTSGKRFRTQKLKTDSGIEINFPSHFYNNNDMMEFINNPDGTISILIKNVGRVINK